MITPSRVLDETVFDTKQAAAYARKTVRTVIRWITDGYPAAGGVVRLEAIRSGRTWVTSREAVLRFLAACDPPAHPPVEPPAVIKRPSKSADESLARWGVKLGDEKKAKKGKKGD